jgi:DNA-binding NarL/FixJ family response regulator
VDEARINREELGDEHGAMPDILLVEDNPLHVRLVKSMLCDIWVDAENLRFAKRLDKALQMVREREPACVLLDLVLPDADDFQALKAVLAVAPKVPIVVLSSHEDDEMAMEAVREGAQAYLVKGTVGSDQLARAIHFAMQRQRMERSEPLSAPAPAVAAAEAAVAPAPLNAAAPAAEVVEEDGALAVIDHAGKMLFVDAAFADLVGETVVGVAGSGLADYTHPNDQVMLREAIALGSVPPNGAGSHGPLTIRLRHASGNNLRVKMFLTRLVDETGAEVAFVARTHAVADVGTAASGAYTVMTEWVGG